MTSNDMMTSNDRKLLLFSEGSLKGPNTFEEFLVRPLESWKQTEEVKKKLSILVMHLYTFSLIYIFLRLWICKCRSFYQECKTIFQKILALIRPIIG